MGDDGRRLNGETVAEGGGRSGADGEPVAASKALAAPAPEDAATVLVASRAVDASRCGGSGLSIALCHCESSRHSRATSD